MEKILVIRRLNFFTFFFALIFRIFRVKIFFYESCNGFNTVFTRKIVESLSLQKIDFQSCLDIGIDPRYGIKGDVTDLITDELVEISIINKFTFLFSNVLVIEEKLRLIAKKFVISRCESVFLLSVWLNGNYKNISDHKTKIYLLGGICKIRENFLLKSCINIDIKPVFVSNFYIFNDFLLKITSYFYRLLSNFIYSAKKGGNEDRKSSITDNVDISSYKVLFFPHQSIFYGDLFVKDHFYSKNKKSVLF